VSRGSTGEAPEVCVKNGRSKQFWAKMVANTHDTYTKGIELMYLMLKRDYKGEYHTKDPSFCSDIWLSLLGGILSVN